MYVLSVQYSCAVVSVFLFGGKANLVLLTLFYSTLIALSRKPLRTDGRTEIPIHSLRMGWRNLFSSCALCFVSVWFWWKQGFDQHTRVLLRVQYCCGGVLVIWFWWEIDFGVTHIISVQYSCVAVSVFWL